MKNELTDDEMTEETINKYILSGTYTERLLAINLQAERANRKYDVRKNAPEGTIAASVAYLLEKDKNTNNWSSVCCVYNFERPKTL